MRAVGSAEPCPTTSFWKGSGRASHVDFFSPDALAWWRSMLGRVLALGVDGMKVDGTDLQLLELGDPVLTAAGPRSATEYSAAMYRTFLDQLRARRPDAAILARPYADENGVARWYAPPDASTASWVGDQEQSWEGLREALLEIFVAARAGYPVVGSDVGGFRPPEEGGLDARLFVRWAQLGAWLPLFEIGGRGEHRPWAFGEEATAIFRRHANAHRELVPYLHHLAIRAHRTGAPAVRPIGDGPSAWAGDWRYTLGDDVLVAALGEDVAEREVELPPGLWHDWWEPARRHEGPTTIRVATPLGHYPVFVRAGAVLPVAPARGDVALLVFPGAPAEHRLHLDEATELAVALAPSARGVRLTASGAGPPLPLRVHRGDGTFLAATLPAGGGVLDLDLASGIVGDGPPGPRGGGAP